MIEGQHQKLFLLHLNHYLRKKEAANTLLHKKGTLINQFDRQK